MSASSTSVDLLDRADAARAAGRADEAARLYDEAISECRDLDDLAGWIRAALGAASLYLFGTEPGKLPAQLYDVLARTTDDADRARLAAALARCWAYAGQPARAVRFADEAVAHAQRRAEPQLLADCLDAALATHWGPDELQTRITLAARLDEVAAHVLDPAARTQAHLWGLQIACEVLDIPAMHQHMRALERLGEESPRAEFFAASRRLMLDLMRGRTDTADRLIEVAARAGRRSGLADAWMVIAALTGYTAVQSGDTVVCARLAAQCEEFALAEGATTVCAEAAFLWTGAGDLARARRLVRTFAGSVLEDLPHDVNWLLVQQCVLEAALASGERPVIETGARLLGPYAGRAVVNAGAVMFHGVTDDTLARAAEVLGDAAAAQAFRARALATYERIGASWWRERLRNWKSPLVPVAAPRVRLHETADGLWLIGAVDSAAPMRALRGYGYLHTLVEHPGRPVPALDLIAGDGHVTQSDLGEVIDKEAITAYRQRLRDIDDDLAQADEWCDSARSARLSAERAALIRELAASTGLGGRARTTGSSQERARIAVTKAITAAITRITAVDAALGQHLRGAVHTGARCRYEPPAGDGREWILAQ